MWCCIFSWGRKEWLDPNLFWRTVTWTPHTPPLPYPLNQAHLIFHHGCCQNDVSEKNPQNGNARKMISCHFLVVGAPQKKGRKKNKFLLLRKNSPLRTRVGHFLFCLEKKRVPKKRSAQKALSKSMGKWCNQLSASPRDLLWCQVHPQVWHSYLNHISKASGTPCGTITSRFDKRQWQRFVLGIWTFLGS